MSGRGWVGVDFDGTIAEYDGWKGDEHLGAPIPRMVSRVQDWLRKGTEVRIFTARVACGENEDPHRSERQRQLIEEWCERHIGQKLKVTNAKDFQMIELWDDRAVGVVPNTGIRIGAPQ